MAAEIRYSEFAKNLLKVEDFSLNNRKFINYIDPSFGKRNKWLKLSPILFLFVQIYICTKMYSLKLKSEFQYCNLSD